MADDNDRPAEPDPRPSSTVYLVGAGGQLGTALLASPGAPADVVPLTSADIDITDAASVIAALAALREGDVVLNCAAYTDVDGAETDREQAFAVNAVGVGHLASATVGAGAWLIHVSTDYVFPGTATDDTGAPRTAGYEPGEVSTTREPATVYGASKLAGERLALSTDPRSTVVRTAWVYTGGPEDRDFVGTMRRLEASRDTISVVDDQTGSPTYAPDLADALWALVAHGPDETVVGRVLHGTNAGSATWFDVAQAVFVEVGAEPGRVRPCTTDEFPRPAPRPAFSVLSEKAWHDAGLPGLREWRTALHAAITRGGGDDPRADETPSEGTQLDTLSQ